MEPNSAADAASTELNSPQMCASVCVGDLSRAFKSRFLASASPFTHRNDEAASEMRRASAVAQTMVT